MATKSRKSSSAPSAPALKAKNFEVMLSTDVPHGRRGKHKDFIAMVLDDLQELEAGNAIRIPLKDLPFSKEKIRSALSRAVHQRKIQIVTSTDEKFLYIWHAEDK
jgi:hypothetical protein